MILVKLNPLRKFHFETWDDLGEALGVAGARPLANHRGAPRRRCKKPSAALKANVDALFEQKFPSPLPPYQRRIRQRLTAAKREPGSTLLLEVVQEIEGIVADAAPRQPLNAAGMKYLEYLAQHARAVLNGKDYSKFGGKSVWRASLARAIAALEEGRAIIAHALEGPANISDMKELKELDVWLFLNWVVAVGSHVPDDQPPDPAKLAETLRAHNALPSFRAALEILPYEWRVAYSGLDVASRLHECDTHLQLDECDRDLQLFYSRLCDFDIGFADFTHTPGEVPSIADNPGLEFFRQRCRLNPTITTLSHEV